MKDLDDKEKALNQKKAHLTEASPQTRSKDVASESVPKKSKGSAPSNSSILRESIYILAKKKALDDKEKALNQKKAHLTEASPQTWSNDVQSESVPKTSKGSAPYNNQQSRRSESAQNDGSIPGRKATRISDTLDFYSNKLRFNNQQSSSSETPQNDGSVAGRKATRMTDNLDFYSNTLRTNNQQSRRSETPQNDGSVPGRKASRTGDTLDFYSNKLQANNKQSSRSETPQNDGSVPGSKALIPCDNLDFYSNKLRAKPSGKTIEEMLRWKGDYSRLESNHSYIEWLFPIPEGGGVNGFTQALQKHEALAIQSDGTMRRRLITAYKMMLDFYGMELARDDGSIRRCNTNWKDRYAHLNRSSDNYLIITRIIKSLGCLGFEHFQLPWVKFLIEEAFGEYGELPGVRSSVFVWVYAINDRAEQGTICSQLARFGIYGPEEGLCYEPEPDYDSEEGSDGEGENQTEYGATGI